MYHISFQQTIAHLTGPNPFWTSELCHGSQPILSEFSCTIKQYAPMSNRPVSNKSPWQFNGTQEKSCWITECSIISLPEKRTIHRLQQQQQQKTVHVCFCTYCISAIILHFSWTEKLIFYINQISQQNITAFSLGQIMVCHDQKEDQVTFHLHWDNKDNMEYLKI